MDEVIISEAKQSKKKFYKKKLDDLLNEDDTIIETPYKNKLKVYVISGQVKDLYGQLTETDLNNLSEQECENIHKICELKLAAKMSDSVIDGIVTVVGNLCSRTLPIENKDKYISDLKNDYIINNELKNVAGNVAMRTGKLMGLLTFALITASNINLYKKTAQEIDKEVEKESKELEQELSKEIDKEIKK